MDGEKGRLNGSWNNEQSTVSSHQNRQKFLTIRMATGSCLSLLNRPRGGRKWLGKIIVKGISHIHCINFLICTCYRLRELHTLKGHVESVVKLKGLDIDTIQQHYTV